MTRTRLAPCPNCERPSLFLVPDLTKTPPAEGLEEGISSLSYWVKNQLCSCPSIAHVVIDSSNDDMFEEYVYTPQVNIVQSQPGSLGVDGSKSK